MKANVITPPRRESFSNIQALIDIPDLLSIQTKAYQQFLQEFVAEERRINLLKQEWLPLMVWVLPKWAIELAQLMK